VRGISDDKSVRRMSDRFGLRLPRKHEVHISRLVASILRPSSCISTQDNSQTINSLLYLERNKIHSFPSPTEATTIWANVPSYVSSFYLVADRPLFPLSFPNLCPSRTRPRDRSARYKEMGSETPGSFPFPQEQSRANHHCYLAWARFGARLAPQLTWQMSDDCDGPRLTILHIFRGFRGTGARGGTPVTGEYNDSVSGSLPQSLIISERNSLRAAASRLRPTC
jgi:hypothetical protein